MQSVILDPIPKPSVSRHEQRLEEILKAGPAGEIEQQKTFQQKTLAFCGSALGISVIASILFFFLLLLLQPSYIFKRNGDNQRSLVEINYTSLIILSLIAGACVFFVPYLISRGA